MIIVILGVSGSGKTTIGKQLSEKLEIPFFDADDFHPQSNIDKMSGGNPLNDDDRYPWLFALANKIDEWSSKQGAILACSALKEKYRKLLSSNSDEKILWVHLSGSQSLIKERIEKRNGHFMNADLLSSQFNDLEVPEYGIQMNISETPEEIINTIISKL